VALIFLVYRVDSTKNSDPRYDDLMLSRTRGPGNMLIPCADICVVMTQWNICIHGNAWSSSSLMEDDGSTNPIVPILLQPLHGVADCHYLRTK
jgi:hypothetical protein